MTTNAGSDRKDGTVGFGGSVSDQGKDRALKALKDFLRPEFINRVDEIVYFNKLNEENFREIAKLMLSELSQVMKEKNMAFTYDDALLDYLSKKSFSLTYGARNLRRLIQKEVEDAIATEIVDKHKGKISSISVTATDDAVEVVAVPA